MWESFVSAQYYQISGEGASYLLFGFFILLCILSKSTYSKMTKNSDLRLLYGKSKCVIVEQFLQFTLLHPPYTCMGYHKKYQATLLSNRDIFLKTVSLC